MAPVKKLNNLITRATSVLKGGGDDEVIQVISKVLHNLGKYNLVRQFKENGAKLPKKNKKKRKRRRRHRVTLDQPLVPVFIQKQGKRNRILESRLEQEMHPLQNDLIMKNIFEYCSVTDLKSCRLVSTKWLDVSLKSWRGKAVLQTDKIIENDLVKTLTKKRSQFRRTPFKSYIFTWYEPTDSLFAVKEKIMDKFSSSIEYLDIECDDFELMISLIFSKLPVLRRCCLRFHYDDFDKQCETRISEGRDCPLKNLQPNQNLEKLQLRFMHRNVTPTHLNWKRFFKKLPALKSLQLSYEWDYCLGRESPNMRILQDILKAVKKARKKGNFTTLNLEELDILRPHYKCISSPFPDAVAESIVKSKLPLRRLHIDLSTPTPFRISPISNVLEAHAESLEFLECACSHEYYLEKSLLWPFLHWTVQLPKLKELVLLNGCVWAFHFLHSLELPCPEILEIKEMERQEQKDCNLVRVVLDWKDVDTKRKFHLDYPEHFTFAESFFPKLRRFSYSGPRHFRRSELRDLAEAMPNLTDICMPLSAKTFPVVCEVWPGLTSLRVGQYFHGEYPLIDDYAITGLPVPGETTKSKSRQPNITDLKELRCFVVEKRTGGSFSRIPLITDLSATYGFLQLPKLNVLKLGSIAKFSLNVETALKTHVSVIEIRELY